MKKSKGISLIVLIITIIVVIILAAVVILTLSKNNPIESAKEARFKEDVRAYRDELNMYISNEYQRLAGQRDNKITATGYEKNSTSEEYNNSVYKYLSSFKKKYENKIAIENDELVYVGRDKKEREWINNIVKMNPMLTIKYVYENGEKAAQTYEEVITDGAYELESPIIEGYEPDSYMLSDKIERDTEITVTYYPWSEGLVYEELTDGTYTVAGIGTFTGYNLVIPEKYNGKDVTQIKQNSFLNQKNIKKLIISPSVKSINDHAFKNCSNIENITISNSVLNIKEYSFEGISKIDQIEIHKGLKELGNGAFYNCQSLKKVIFNDNFNLAKNGAFYECNNWSVIENKTENSKFTIINNVVYTIELDKLILVPGGKNDILYIDDNVKIIEDKACYWCNNLLEVHFPKKLQEIGRYAFYGCSQLRNICLPEGTVIIKDHAFKQCVNVDSFSMSDTIKVIESYSIEGLKKLKNIEIPKSVNTLGSGIFIFCEELESINYLGSINDWNSIRKDTNWNQGNAITKIICTDGEIVL